MFNGYSVNSNRHTAPDVLYSYYTTSYLSLGVFQLFTAVVRQHAAATVYSIRQW